ncbi:hypothetical protein [Aminipila luticellarii]|uniref:Uncharacterized protein n=1 Tax=Aminipila luticellarii TaxID=2507160 RepID=A0A410PWW9_9FIRM|nr:hypothetical protein [Aminipila luticellarii]QAT43462.1 hypothetical protein EQM06_09670 [Aminipila luticellarii]
MKFFIYSNDKGYDYGCNYYTGKTYVVNHEKYAVTDVIENAKIYTKQHLAYGACDSLNTNTASNWDVGVMEDDGKIIYIKSTQKNDGNNKEAELDFNGGDNIKPLSPKIIDGKKLVQIRELMEQAENEMNYFLEHSSSDSCIYNQSDLWERRYKTLCEVVEILVS